MLKYFYQTKAFISTKEHINVAVLGEKTLSKMVH